MLHSAMATPILRTLALADLPELLRLYVQVELLDPQTDRGLIARTWARILDEPMLIYVGAFDGETLASTCHAVIVPNLTRGARPYAVIENVATDERLRRRGFGSLAIRHLITRCWESGCYKVSLTSGIHRGPAHAFYESLGFDRDAKHAFVLKPGAPLTT
jgi:GNAT superfamily N-acetyltransferase